MDSGKSGNLNSSSGDDEYDSRCDSISALLAQPPHSAAMLSKLFEQPLPPLPGEQYSALNSPPLSQHSVPGGSLAGESARPVSFPLAAELQHGSGACGAITTVAGISEQTRVLRNPKKRSRASRRAPTTMLTTDTTNFRAMVQEFTGIPAPPFTSLPFSRTLGSRAAASHFDNIRQSPPYLRRPFAQKIQPLQPAAFPPPASSSFLPSTLVDVLASSTTNNISPGSTTINPSKYQQISQSATLLGISSNTSQLKMGGYLDALGSANAALTALPSLISPTETSAAMLRRSNNTPASWDGGGGGGLRSKPNNADQGQSQTLQHTNNIFSCNFPAANGKLNVPATSSNFHGYKAPENVGGSRGEGMVESWICSSE